MFLAALAPLLCLFLIVFFTKRSVLAAASVSLLLLLVISFFPWGMDVARVTSAAVKGFFVATEIILIVFGALLILEILKQNNLFIHLRGFFNGISRDRRVQTVLIGLALVSFIEGAAGFGTPAALAAPLLVALGFAPALSVALALIGDSVPVIFGAVGLPVTFGIASAFSGAGSMEGTLGEIIRLISSLNVVGNVIVPLVLTWMVVSSERGRFREFWEFVPFALFSGLAISLPALLTAWYLGPELPSLLGGFVGLLLISLFAKRKILLPERVFVFPGDDCAETGGLKERTRRGILRALLPYGLIIVLLTVSRAPFLPVKYFLSNLSVARLPELFGRAIDYSFAPFYSAGVLFIAVALLSALILRMGRRDGEVVVARASAKVGRAYAMLIVVLILVQILIYSGENGHGFASMPIVLAHGIAKVFGGLWPVVAPVVGAFGAFVAGSATVSNLLFSSFQYGTAQITGFSAALILSLQGVGAAAGNMIALHNIIAALAAVGIVGREKEVIKMNIVPLMGYLLIIGLVGFALSVP